MTRINVGVHPSELCDQHLAAEYRELPRLWGAPGKGRAPEHFTLGTGHVLWCKLYQGMLADRYIEILREKQRRGMHSQFTTIPAAALYGRHPDPVELERARPLVLARIAERLAGMKQPPRWTGSAL